MSAEPESQPLADSLQFDRAEHIEAERASVCARCSKPLAGTYYHDGDATLCADCGRVRQEVTASDRSMRTLLRAFAFGVGAAIAGAALYYGVMRYFNSEWALVAIAIGWLVGRAVAKATHARSARRHQVLAVALTYFAVALAYAPAAVKAEKEGNAAVMADSAFKADSAFTATPTIAGADSAKSEPPVGFGRFMLATVVVLGLVLALPVMGVLGSMPGGLLTMLIIGIGLMQAWRIAAESNVVVTGPHALGAAPT